MRLYCISLTFEKADLDLRGAFALDGHERFELCRRLTAAPSAEAPPPVHAPATAEALALATCNRTEVYWVAENDDDSAGGEASGDQTVLAQLAELKRQPSPAHAAWTLYRDAEVIEHLLCLACGLRSLILGETEIMGQLKTAYADALANGFTGKVLNRVFQQAFTTAKQIRTGTALGRFRASVAGTAVTALHASCGGFAGKHIAVWGTGAVGLGVVRDLQAAAPPAATITVLTRSPQAAQEKFPGCLCRNSNEAEAVLAACDILIACTAAPHHVVTTRLLVGRKPELVLCDLAVPRNIAPEAARLPGVRLLTLDELHAPGHDRLGAAPGEQAAIAARLHEAAHRYWRCLVAAHQQICLAHWRAGAEALLTAEMEELAADWPELPPELRERYRKFARRLMNRTLHWPTEALHGAMRADLPCASFLHPHAPEDDEEESPPAHPY